MTQGPHFDDLVGSEPVGSERDTLLRVHELLVQAGPPPELTPPLKAGPALREIQVRRRRQVRRRTLVLLAAALTAAAFFAVGYGVGHSGGGRTVAETLSLQGTARAPRASATLQVDQEVAGNWPMSLTVSNLPKLAAPSYYVVYLVRNGHPFAQCGTFVVSNSSKTLTLPLTAPYTLQRGDTWVVTRQPWNATSPGPTVLRPVRT